MRRAAKRGTNPLEINDGRPCAGGGSAGPVQCVVDGLTERKVFLGGVDQVTPLPLGSSPSYSHTPSY